MSVVLVATSADWPDLFADDHPFLEALRARGVDARAAVWDDPAVRWDEADLVVLRSIWDYTRKRDRFVAWAWETEAQTPMQNPARIVEWNSHKHYLRDLEARGIPIVPTEWVDAGERLDVAAVARARGWEEMVVKPCVTAGARGAVRGDAASLQPLVDPAQQDMMLQPYLRETEGDGEHALVHFGGALAHVMRKDAALAVADYSSSRVRPAEPHDDELRLARALLEVTGPLLYARVDTIVVDGRAHLMELEAIEPQLFFRAAPGSAEQLADLVLPLL